MPIVMKYASGKEVPAAQPLAPLTREEKLARAAAGAFQVDSPMSLAEAEATKVRLAACLVEDEAALAAAQRAREREHQAYLTAGAAARAAASEQSMPSSARYGAAKAEVEKAADRLAMTRIAVANHELVWKRARYVDLAGQASVLEQGEQARAERLAVLTAQRAALTEALEKEAGESGQVNARRIKIDSELSALRRDIEAAAPKA